MKAAIKSGTTIARATILMICLVRSLFPSSSSLSLEVAAASSAAGSPSTLSAAPHVRHFMSLLKIGSPQEGHRGHSVSSFIIAHTFPDSFLL